MRMIVLVDRTDLRSVQAAFKRLPKEASKSLRERTQELVSVLANRMQSAGQSDSPQSALVAPTVKARKDRVPTITAGGTKRVGRNKVPAHKVLYGAEFGANTLPQFRPHRGADSYWLFRTFEQERDEFFKMWKRVATDVARDWSRGADL